jgi:ssDNA-binding Zn-finger/Zn-ribbon topoisomerase 1
VSIRETKEGLGGEGVAGDGGPFVLLTIISSGYLWSQPHGGHIMADIDNTPDGGSDAAAHQCLLEAGIEYLEARKEVAVAMSEVVGDMKSKVDEIHSRLGRSADGVHGIAGKIDEIHNKFVKLGLIDEMHSMVLQLVERHAAGRAERGHEAAPPTQPGGAPYFVRLSGQHTVVRRTEDGDTNEDEDFAIFLAIGISDLEEARRVAWEFRDKQRYGNWNEGFTEVDIVDASGASVAYLVEDGVVVRQPESVPPGGSAEPTVDRVLRESLVRFASNVPDLPVEELLKEAVDSSAEASYELGWDNYTTAAYAGMASERYLVAAALRGSDDENARRALQVARARLRHRLIDRHVMLEEDAEDVAQSTVVERLACDDAIGEFDLPTALALVDELHATGSLLEYVESWDDDGGWVPLSDAEAAMLKERHRDVRAPVIDRCPQCGADMIERVVPGGHPKAGLVYHECLDCGLKRRPRIAVEPLPGDGDTCPACGKAALKTVWVSVDEDRKRMLVCSSYPDCKHAEYGD